MIQSTFRLNISRRVQCAAKSMLRMGQLTQRSKAKVLPLHLQCSNFSSSSAATSIDADKFKVDNSSLLRQESFIGGKWVQSSQLKTFPVLDPASGEIVATVADCGLLETKEAIISASKAFSDGAWAKMVAKERASILQKWAQLMHDNSEDLARIMTIECGKPLTESRGEVVYAASFFEWFAEECKRNGGSLIPENIAGRRLLTVKQPVGVTAAITPWNFPAAMITRKAGPALAAGCTMICKPAQDTPLTALALASLGAEAGLPDGVFNVVTASAEQTPLVGTELCQNPIVKKLSFTGSTDVGKALYRLCAGTVKRVSLELGGNAPFIVFEDADIEAAVQGAIASKFRNAGQTCVCSNRFFVHERVIDKFVPQFTAAVSALRIGHGLADGVQVGPLINKSGLDKVHKQVLNALDGGANIACGGGPVEGVGEGNFYLPTVLTGVELDMDCFQNETFGPLAPIVSFSDEDEVIRMANNTSAGLAAYFYTRDLGRTWRVAEKLDYGMVGVNEGIMSTEVAPFGGVKESGLGREGATIGLEEYVETKYVCMGGIGS